MTDAERFFGLFAGLERVHGCTTVKGDLDAKGKMKSSSWLEREPLTVALWERHLKGEQGLGIVPIRDDATCRFGAIDIDEYDIDINKLEAEVRKFKLPLVVCRTKSGGVHLYLFASEDLPASLIRDKLMEWAVALGHAGVEIFPKQTQLASENDVGNWINMPYFSGDATERYAIRNGKKLKVADFFKLASRISVDHTKIEKVEVGKVDPDDPFTGAPPCLQHFVERGCPSGNRNNTLFAFGVYLRKRHGDDDWEEKLDRINGTIMDPALGHKEVSSVAKAVKKKDYEYSCDKPPLIDHCGRQICLARKYGIGSADDDPGVAFGRLVKVLTDPPIWIWDVDGARIELATQDMMDQRRFQRCCIESLDKWPRLIKASKWQKLVNKNLADVERIEAPPDATPQGQLNEHLEAFCTQRAFARTKEEILLGKPYHLDGMTYFRSGDFMRYLANRQVRGINERSLWSKLRKMRAQHKFFHGKKGKGINCWAVPEYDKQTEEFDAPKTEGEEF